MLLVSNTRYIHLYKEQSLMPLTGLHKMLFLGMSVLECNLHDCWKADTLLLCMRPTKPSSFNCKIAMLCGSGL